MLHLRVGSWNYFKVPFFRKGHSILKSAHSKLSAVAFSLLVSLNACSGGGSGGGLPISPGQTSPGTSVTPTPVPVGSSGNAVDPSASPNSEALLPMSVTTLSTASVPTGTVLFSDNFPQGDYSQFITAYGNWTPCLGQPAICSQGTNNETNAGSTSFSDYTVSANIIIKNVNPAAKTRSGADLAFRVKDASHFYEL